MEQSDCDAFSNILVKEELHIIDNGSEVHGDGESENEDFIESTMDLVSTEHSLHPMSLMSAGFSNPSSLLDERGEVEGRCEIKKEPDEVEGELGEVEGKLSEEEGELGEVEGELGEVKRELCEIQDEFDEVDECCEIKKDADGLEDEPDEVEGEHGEVEGEHGEVEGEEFHPMLCCAVEMEDSDSRNNTLFECRYCDSIFFTSQELCEHENNHDKNSRFACHQCTKAFPYYSNLKQHELTHIKPTKAKSLQCKPCHKSFPNLQELQSHYEAKHNERIVLEEPPEMTQCEFCLRVVDSLATHTCILYQCRFCSETFPYPGILKEHEQNHLEEYPYLACPKEYRQPYVSGNHTDSPCSFRCDSCPKAFSCARHLANHRKVHKETLQCNLCPSVFSRTSSLTHHLNAHNKDRDSFKCDHCPKEFRYLTCKIKHEWSHNVFKCYECSKSFETGRAFMAHEETVHLEKPPLQCKYCPMRFYKKEQHSLHVKKHVEAFPFKCKFCRKLHAFESTMDLMRHIHKVHLNKPSFQSVDILSI